MLEPEIFDLIPEGRSVDFSGEVFPAALEAGPAALRLRGRRLLGGRRDHGRLPQGARGHLGRQGRGRHVRVSSCARASGSARGRRSIPRPASTRPPSSGRTAPSTRTPSWASYTTLGANTRMAERAEVRRSVIGENSYWGRRRGWRVRCWAVPATCGSAPGASRVRWWGRAASSAPHAEVRGDVKVYPYKVVEAGAQVNASIVWESGGARDALRPRGRAGHRQRRRQPRAGRSPGQGLGVEASRRAPTSPPPATPAGRPGCSSAP